MRMTQVWAKIAMENVSLKWATAALSLITIALMIGLFRMSFRVPLIVEKGCFSAVLHPEISNEPTNTEIKAFLIEVMSFRFDSVPTSKIRDVSLEENEFRLKEQEMLRQRQITQRVIVNNISMEGKEILIEADRILTIGQAKTILPFPLRVEIQKTTRTEANPYGLVLTKTALRKGEHEK